jgi:hypothetical protein
MPDVSQKQHNFMEGIAHGMKPRRGHGPSVAQAKEFVAADKALGKFSAGGLVGKSRMGDIPQARLPFLRK